MKREHLYIGALIVLALIGPGLLVYSTLTKALEPSAETKQEEVEDMIVFEAPCQTCVYVTQTASVNEKNNPILNVQVYKEGLLLSSYQNISGRSWTQNLDRNISGNSSPSPKGEYVIQAETTGYHVETGGVFLPYEPTFSTQRSALGFHIDPSWGKDNGEDGTRGCMAFKNMTDYKSFVTDVTSNNITKLVIDY